VLSHAALNALLNGAAAILLFIGHSFIRRGKMSQHRACMIAAFLTSSAFLISYVVYHVRVGSVPFQGQGWIRPVYFSILFTHVVLAAAIVPLALVTLWRALYGQFDRHRRIARWTYPIWMYVSVTGVVVYVLLYHLYATGS
jgi:uncharacterized membrane protein YozB (DUF420 family)